MHKILVMGYKAAVQILLKEALLEEGYDVFSAKDPAMLESLIQQVAPDLIVCHLNPDTADGLCHLQNLRRSQPDLPAILFIDDPCLSLPPRWVSAYNYLVVSLNLGALRRMAKRVLDNRISAPRGPAFPSGNEPTKEPQVRKRAGRTRSRPPPSSQS